MSQTSPGDRVDEALADAGLPTPDVVIEPDADRLGEYVVADYLRTRRGRRAR